MHTIYIYIYIYTYTCNSVVAGLRPGQRAYFYNIMSYMLMLCHICRYSYIC